MAGTHFKELHGRILVTATAPTATDELKDGTMYYDTDDNALYVRSSGVWRGIPMTTSTSTSSTTTSTSSTTTSTSTTTTTQGNWGFMPQTLDEGNYGIRIKEHSTNSQLRALH